MQNRNFEVVELQDTLKKLEEIKEKQDEEQRLLETIKKLGFQMFGLESKKDSWASPKWKTWQDVREAEEKKVQRIKKEKEELEKKLDPYRKALNTYKNYNSTFGQTDDDIVKMALSKFSNLASEEDAIEMAIATLTSAKQELEMQDFNEAIQLSLETYSTEFPEKTFINQGSQHLQEKPSQTTQPPIALVFPHEAEKPHTTIFQEGQKTVDALKQNTKNPSLSNPKSSRFSRRQKIGGGVAIGTAALATAGWLALDYVGKQKIRKVLSQYGLRPELLTTAQRNLLAQGYRASFAIMRYLPERWSYRRYFEGLLKKRPQLARFPGGVNGIKVLSEISGIKF